MLTPLVIIGAGPAGIASAILARKKGLSSQQMVVLEKTHQIAHMIAQKYPDEKPVLANYKGQAAVCLSELCLVDMSKDEFLNYLASEVEKHQIHITFHATVTSIKKMKAGDFIVTANVNGKSEIYHTQAVILAIGKYGSPATLNAKIGEGAAIAIHQDLQQLNLEKHQKVLVVGGGDTASEYAQILHSRGHEVALSYRKQIFNRMLPVNHDKINHLIDTEVVKFYPNSEITSIEVISNDRYCCYLNSGTKIEVNAVVLAIGGVSPGPYLNSLGIRLTQENNPFEIFYQLPEMEGLYLVGDLALGAKGGSINLAFNSAWKAVSEACKYQMDCPL